MPLQSKYNDLMTQSDKDFITRIQVSQLVTQDPYAEDFYAQVFGAILRSRLGMSSEGVLKFGSGGVGVGLPKSLPATPGTGAATRAGARWTTSRAAARIATRAARATRICPGSWRGPIGR